MRIRVIIILSLLTLIGTGLPSLTACGPSAQEAREYNLEMAAQYDAKAQVEEQQSQKYFNEAQQYLLIIKRSVVFQQKYEELMHQSQLHHEKALEYRYMANEYRLKASR